jgi:hypothetical protein
LIFLKLLALILYISKMAHQHLTPTEIAEFINIFKNPELASEIINNARKSGKQLLLCALWLAKKEEHIVELFGILIECSMLDIHHFTHYLIQSGDYTFNEFVHIARALKNWDVLLRVLWYSSKKEIFHEILHILRGDISVVANFLQFIGSSHDEIDKFVHIIQLTGDSELNVRILSLLADITKFRAQLLSILRESSRVEHTLMLLDLLHETANPEDIREILTIRIETINPNIKTAVINILLSSPIYKTSLRVLMTALRASYKVADKVQYLLCLQSAGIHHAEVSEKVKLLQMSWKELTLEDKADLLFFFQKSSNPKHNAEFKRILSIIWDSAEKPKNRALLNLVLQNSPQEAQFQQKLQILDDEERERCNRHLCGFDEDLVEWRVDYFNEVAPTREGALGVFHDYCAILQPFGEKAQMVRLAELVESIRTKAFYFDAMKNNRTSSEWRECLQRTANECVALQSIINGSFLNICDGCYDLHITKSNMSDGIAELDDFFNTPTV